MLACMGPACHAWTGVVRTDRHCMHGCGVGHELCMRSGWLTLLLVCACRTSWTASEASLHLCDSPLARTGLLTTACQTMLEMVHVLKQCLAAIWSRSIFQASSGSVPYTSPVVCLPSDYYYHQYPEEGKSKSVDYNALCSGGCRLYHLLFEWCLSPDRTSCPSR